MGYQLEGKTVFQGIKVSIENAPGSVRSGVDRDGKKWITQMELIYGRIPYAKGADGEALDVFIDQSNPMAEKVFVVHIKHPDTGAYDEDKVFLGFDTEKDVKEAFKLHYNGWTRFWGDVTEYSVDEFKEAIKQGGVNLKKSIGAELWDSVVVSGIGKSNPDDIEEFIGNELEGSDEYTEAAKEHPKHAKTFKKIAKDEKKHRGMLKRVLAKLKTSKVKKAKPLGEKTKGKPMEDIGDDIVKAVAIKGRAGLALIPVSTKSGHMTKKWKRVAPKAKKETGPAQPKRAMTPHLFRWKGKNGKQNEQVMLLTPESSKAPMKEFRKLHRNTKDVYFRKITGQEFEQHQSGGVLPDYNIGGVRGNFDEFHKVPVDVIEPDPTQPRKEFDKAGLRQLARTFKNVSQLQNIIVRPHPDNPDKFIIIGGERRWRAAQLAGIAHLEAKIMNPPEHQVHEIQTIENYSRKQMTSSEDATAFLNMYNSALKKLSRKTQAKAKKGMIIGDARDFVAERMGVSKETVRKMLQISVGLDPQIQRLMGKEGGVSNAVAYKLSQLPQDRQPAAMNKVSKMKDAEALPILGGMIAALKEQSLFGDSFQLEGERIKQPELEHLEKLAVHQKRAKSYSKMIGGAARLLSKVAKEGGIPTLVRVLLKYDEKKKSPAQRLKEIEKIEVALRQMKTELTKVKHEEAIQDVVGAQAGLFKAVARVFKKKSDIVKGTIKGKPGLVLSTVFSKSGKPVKRWVRFDKPEKKTKEKEPDSLNKEALKYFGTTEDVRETGYVMESGEMLDLSGGRNGERWDAHEAIEGILWSETRHLVDHEKLEKYNDDFILYFVSLGNMRMDMAEGDNYAQMMKPPTENQKKRIIQAANEVMSGRAGGYDGFSIEVMGENGKSDFYRTYRDVDPRRIIQDIDYWFEHGKEPRRLSKLSQFRKGVAIKGRPGLYFDPQKHRWVRHGKPISSFEAAKHLIQNTKTLQGYYGIQNRLERLAGGLSKSERTKMEKINRDRAQYHGDKDLKKVGQKPVSPERRGAGMDTSVDREKNFKKWFGKSKVVDKSGKPLVVYHGTNEDFKKFKPGMKWFAKTSQLADEYSDTKQYVKKRGNRIVIPVYIKIENPFDANISKHIRIKSLMSRMASEAVRRGNKFDRDKAMSAWNAVVDHWDKIGQDNSEVPIWSHWNETGVEASKYLGKYLKALGFDGILFTEREGQETYGVFSSTQIKSATGNRGTYDPEEQDISKGIIGKVLDFFKAAPMNPEAGGAHLVKRPTLVRRKTGSKMEMRWVSVDQKTKQIRHKKQEDAPKQKGKKAEEGTAEHKGHWMNIRGHKIFVPESDNRTIAAVDDHDKSGHLVGTKLSSSDHKRFMMNTGQMERDKPRSKDAKREGDIKKFKRVKKLARKLPKITEQINKDLGRKDNDIRRVRAAILSIMLKANVRVGNPGSAQFGVKGATTLSKDDITLHGDGVVQLKFTGKSGVSWDKIIKSPELENALKEFMAQTDDSAEPIMKFRTKDGGLREFQDVDLRKNWKEKHGILPKDIRTWSASTMAFKELRRLSELSKGKKLKKNEVKKLMKQAIEKVASEMGHTPAMAKNNYIAPFILHDFMKNGGRFSIDEAKFEVAPKRAKF